MRHDIVVEGPTYRLRPVRQEDAAVMIEIRGGDPERGQFMNPTSPRVEDQEAYLEGYFLRDDDVYFVIEHIASGRAEGLVTICDIGQGAIGWAEWGRWVLRPGSPAAMESAWLVYRAGFEQLNLELMYCRTVAANTQVVSFHDGCGLSRHATLENYVTLREISYDSIEHRLSRAEWPAVDARLRPLVERFARRSARKAGQP